MSTKKRKLKGFDVETTGLNPFGGARIFAYVITDYYTGASEVIRIDHKSKKKNKEGEKKLQGFFDDTSIVKIAHNFQFEYSMLLENNFHVPNDTIWEDSMIMAICARNDEVSYTLDYLAWKYGRYKCEEDKIVETEGNRLGNYALIDKDVMTRYQIADGERTCLLYGMYVEELQRDERRWNDYRNEIELAKTTYYLEKEGIRYSQRKGKMLRKWLKWQSENAYSAVVRKSWKGINLNSGNQLRKLLFEDKGYEPLGLTKTGLLATGKGVLLELHEQNKDSLLDNILMYRSYTKGIGYLDNYEFHIDSDGVLHPNINTNGAHNTGRQSCTNPNLQNVSNNASLTNPYPVPLRTVFLPKTIREILLFADYSGIEMRLIINATGEPELMTVLKLRGDVHHPTVECFLGVDSAQRLRQENPKLYKTHRSAYKNTGFCIAYGGGDGKVAVTLGKQLEEIKTGVTTYRRRFSRISNFCTSQIGIVKQKGYIETAFGRRLYVPRGKAYMASNYLIQGTAAGVLKRAQVRVQKLIDDWGIGDKFKMVLPIHDEIVFSMHRDLIYRKKEIIQEVSRVMTDMPEIQAPLDVEWKQTRSSWDKARSISI